MASFYGNFFNRSSDLCAFPAFPRDQGYVVEVAIDESVTKPFVCLQAAILHIRNAVKRAPDHSGTRSKPGIGNCTGRASAGPRSG